MADAPPIADEAPTGAGALAARQPARVVVTLGSALLGWVFLAWIALDMGSPLAQLLMPASPRWSLGVTLAIGAMWAVMMAAMMLPSALPMVLAFTDLCRRNREPARGLAFVSAYLLVWLAFSGAATAAQWLLQILGWIDPMAASRSAGLSGVLLLLAGLYQFSPLKKVCLSHCRSPLAFLLGEWRPALAGAFRMGARHGLICIGCCWALMALLFVGGTMNLAWIVALAVAVALEKLAPRGDLLAPLLGIALLAAGAWKLAASTF